MLDIKKDRYRNRRSMAWLAFWLIVVMGVPMLAAGVLFDGIAERIDAMSMFVGTVFGIWVAIITWYFGATTVTDNAELKTRSNLNEDHGQAITEGLE